MLGEVIIKSLMVFDFFDSFEILSMHLVNRTRNMLATILKNQTFRRPNLTTLG